MNQYARRPITSGMKSDYSWCWNCFPSTRRYLSQSIISLKIKHKYDNPSCNHSTTDNNFHRMERDFVGKMSNPRTRVAIILHIYVSLQVKLPFIEKNANCGSISPSTTDCKNQLQKWTLLTGSRGCKACVDCCYFIGSKLQQLRCPSSTRLCSLVSWARRISDFESVCSSLDIMSSNFSSLSTRRLCFCFLSIGSPVVLSLFTKLWIVCLMRTPSSRNLRRQFIADPYFTYVSYRNISCSKVYRTWRTTLLTDCNWEQKANGDAYC
jgi:hypothetical protein